jgi:hypothetical protein
VAGDTGHFPPTSQSQAPSLPFPDFENAIYLRSNAVLGDTAGNNFMRKSSKDNQLLRALFAAARSQARNSLADLVAPSGYRQ